MASGALGRALDTAARVVLGGGVVVLTVLYRMEDHGLHRVADNAFVACVFTSFLLGVASGAATPPEARRVDAAIMAGGGALARFIRWAPRLALLAAILASGRLFQAFTLVALGFWVFVEPAYISWMRRRAARVA